jgi:hypothetical protein
VLALGTLPPLAAWSGDLAATGAAAIKSRRVDVALEEESFSGAGMQIALTAGSISGNAWLPEDSAVHELL